MKGEGPKTSVPKGLVLFFNKTPSLEKNFTQLPSFLKVCFLVLMIIDLCLDFFSAQDLG